MSDILKIYTADQLFDMYMLKVLADAFGLTDFNEGAKIRALLESNSEIISAIQMSFKEALYKSIPIALFQGFGFGKLDAVAAIGYLRPYRKPALWIKYTGAGSSATITSTSLIMSSAVTGAPADAFSLDYASYPKTSDLADAINLLSNWEATLVSDVDSNLLYQYTAKESVGAINYLNTSGLDLMLATAAEISVPAGYSITINGLTIASTISGTIAEGESGVQVMSQAGTTGITGNISVNAVDTASGKGFINSQISGIENVINDSAFSGGAAAETDSQRKTRFSETVNALNAGTSSGIIAALRGISGVRSVGIRSAYPFKGTNTIYVDDGSGIISAELLASCEKVFYGDPDDIINYPGKNAEGIAYNIVAPILIAVNIGVTVYRLPSVIVDLLEIRDAVQSAIEQYVNTRQLGQNVLTDEIIRVGKNSNAAVYKIIVDSPVSDIVINEGEFSKTGAGTGGSVVVTVAIASSI